MKSLKNFNTTQFRWLWLSAVATAALWPLATATRAEQATVQRDRSNVRARPSTASEVVAQLPKGQAVEVLEHKTEPGKEKPMEWLRIPLPADAKCFVAAKLVSNGAAAVDAVNIRCGPGTQFRDVGKLAKGEHVEVVNTVGEWLQIKPTPQCTGWIAAELAEIHGASAPSAPQVPAAPVPAANAPPEVTTPPVAVSPTPAPAAPAIEVVNTDPDLQVAYVVKDGVVRAVKDAANAQGSYELMTPEMNRLQQRICYLDSPQINLDRYQGKHVRVSGNQRWRKGDRYPVIVAERVDMVW
jgi:uncharacterized protein YgiM (DUF1202 family)